MANIVLNIALGRAVELYNRVDLNDPAAAVLWVALLASSGIEADSVLKDVDTFSAMVAGTTNESTNTGYARF
jgi:isopropylmalate/homocitrate/citramalate synthase